MSEESVVIITSSLKPQAKQFNDLASVKNSIPLEVTLYFKCVQRRLYMIESSISNRMRNNIGYHIPSK